MRLISLILTIMISSVIFNGHAQPPPAITGQVFDTDSIPVAGVIIRLYADGKLKSYTNSGKDGSFSIKTAGVSGPATLRFISRSHKTSEYDISDLNTPVKAYLEHEEFTLQEVFVKAPEVRVKGDTITYDVAALTNKGDRNIEAVIKKIPGIQVDEKGGISYDGEPINHFYIEGLDLMGSNYAVASRNISPADISTISVYERHQPKKVLKGEVESKKAALNLKLKKGRILKPIGFIEGGSGYGDHVLWTGNIYGMLISPRNQTIISAQTNNRGFSYGSRGGTTDPFGIFSATPFGIPSIKEPRFMDNESYHATANTLFRLNENMTVRLNIGYTDDTERYQGSSRTEYLNPDGESIIYDETADNRLAHRTAGASAKIENNSERLYISDELRFTGLFADNRYNVNAGESHLQTLGSKNLNFSNVFKTILRNDKNRIIEINSETMLRTTPYVNMTASTAGQPEETGLRQNVKGLTFTNRESTSLSWRLNRNSSIGASMSFEAGYDWFSSNGISGSGRPDNTGNDISGYKLKTTVSPFFKLTKNGNPWRLTWTISCPVSLINIRYDDKNEKPAFHHDNVYPDLQSDLFIRFNQSSTADVSAGCNSSVGDIRNFIDNPIYNTFRNTTTPGNGELEKNRSYFANASYTFRDVLLGLYLNGGISYRHSLHNTMNVRDVTDNATSSSSIRRNSSGNTTTISLSANKNMSRWHTRFLMAANAIWMDRESMRSSTAVKVNNAIYIVSGKVETNQFSDIIAANATLAYSFQRQSFHDLIPPNSFNELSVNGHLSVFPLSWLEIYGDVMFSKVKIADNVYKSNMFADAGVRLSFRKFEIDVMARNLTDMRDYSYSIYNSLDIISYSYALRPFEITASLRFSF